MTPFFLLPFRPDGDSQGSKIFIRNFFKSNSQLRGAQLEQELRLTEPVVRRDRRTTCKVSANGFVGPVQYPQMVLESTSWRCSNVGGV